MQSIKRSNIEPPPPVGIIPLGTGNDMSRLFHWGAAFDKNSIKGHDALYDTLRSLADAEPTPLDRWELRMKGPEAYFSRERPPSFQALSGDGNVRTQCRLPLALLKLSLHVDVCAAHDQSEAFCLTCMHQFH